MKTLYFRVRTSSNVIETISTTGEDVYHCKALARKHGEVIKTVKSFGICHGKNTKIKAK